MTPAEFEKRLKEGSKTLLVYKVLEDQQWHCRECEYTHVGSSQIAGGSGIQGLQRGTGTRPGMEIVSGNHLCRNCGRATRHDRWRGSFTSEVQHASMGPKFARRVIQVLGGRDVVENTERPPNQLTVDHKLPMLRWNASETVTQTDYGPMDDADIRARFQLLKRSNGSVSHNLLKSRACESRFRTGRRGRPFGIAFFHEGGARWEPVSKTDPAGCVGCGWFDFGRWREALNKAVARR